MDSSNPHKIHVVGIGDDGIQGMTEVARTHIRAADLVLGLDRNLKLVADTQAEKIAIGADLSELIRRIEQGAGKRIVVLASGDPLFYGVARYLRDRLGKERFEVVPHVSTMQLAFARVMESWEDAYLANVATKPLESIIDRIRVAETVGLFTSEDCTPVTIARTLLDEGIDYFRAYVCENLGSRDEVVTQGTLQEIGEQEFGPLNVMILVRLPDTPDRPRRTANRQLFGNPDELFLQSRPKRGLLTPAEVRTLALAQLDIRIESVVWDVGAGSGSLSIEAAQLAGSGKVYAIEPDVEDQELIAANAQAFGVQNVEVISGRAPEVFASLPQPDCVFIGGTGRETVGILSEAFDRLAVGGRMVVNVASLENVSAATTTLKQLTDYVGILLVNLARGTHQLDSIRLEAMNPSFLVFVTKQAAKTS